MMATRTTKRTEVTEVVIEHDELRAIIQNHARLESPDGVVVRIHIDDDGEYFARVTQTIAEGS